MASEQSQNMSGHRPLTQEEQIARALAVAAYERGEARLTGSDIAGCTHLVATRQGLFAIDRYRHVRVAFGSFYGLTLRDGAIFAFEACDLVSLKTRRGRIMRLQRDGDRITHAAVLATELDNDCHQIDFIAGLLTLVDSRNQCLLRFDAEGVPLEPVYPLPPIAQRAWSKGYAHINSLLQVGERILLLLHNRTAYTGRPSEVAIFDLTWREILRWQLPGEGCHNLIILEDGVLLSCGSMAGEIIGLDGPIARVSDMMLRGLSVDEESIVIGAGKFSARRDRQAVPGAVLFLDRACHIRHPLPLPGAPTEIRRLDGRDLGLSLFRASFAPLLRGPRG